MSARIGFTPTDSTEPGIALPPQTRLEGYEVEAFIAQGGNSLVYRAFDPGTRQVVAIKEYFPHPFALRHSTQRVTARRPRDSPRFDLGRRAFLDEARSLARFDHPSLVRVLGLFEANGTAYRVMRFTPGPTLRAHRLALGRMPAVEDLRRWVDGLLGALATLHHAGCAHGAVAPANVLLRPGERPLLLGFEAVRKALEPGELQHAAADGGWASAVGAGRAPPADDATAGATAAADVRAVAATLRYCIEGDAPASPTLADAWRREGGPVPIPQHMARLLDVIDACLADGPRERPQSVAEFLRMIRGTDKTKALRAVAPASAGGQGQVQAGRIVGVGIASADAVHCSPEPERTAANDPRAGNETPDEPVPPLPDDGATGRETLAAAPIEVAPEAAVPAATVAERDLAAEALAECGTGALAGTTVAAQADTLAEAEADAATEAEAPAEAHGGAEAAAETRTEAEVQAAGAAEVHGDALAEADVEVDAAVAVESDGRAEPIGEAEAVAEPEAEAKAEAVAEAAAIVEAEAEPEAAFHAETDHRAEAMAVTDSIDERPQTFEPLPDGVFVPQTHKRSLSDPVGGAVGTPQADEIRMLPLPAVPLPGGARCPPAAQPSPEEPVREDLAMARAEEIRIPAPAAADATARATATATAGRPGEVRPVRSRRPTAATAIAASVLLAVVATVWGYRQVDSSRSTKDSPLPASQVAAAPPESTQASSLPEATPAAVAAVPPPAEIELQPTALAAEPDAARPVVAPLAPKPSVPAAKEPAASRKVAVATTKPASPEEACIGRKGFALYRCVQLQCAKSAWADHGDCAALR